MEFWNELTVKDLWETGQTAKFCHDLSSFSVCIAGFLSFTSSRGLGNSVVQSDYKTLSACRERCRGIFTCTAANYHIPTKTCYTFTTTALEYVDDTDYIYEMNTGCIGKSTKHLKLYMWIWSYGCESIDICKLVVSYTQWLL